MNEKIHQLRITPCDDGRGFWLVSNGRVSFYSRPMFLELQRAINAVCANCEEEWRNYEEEKSPPIPFSPPVRSTPTLDDLA